MYFFGFGSICLGLGLGREGQVLVLRVNALALVLRVNVLVLIVTVLLTSLINIKHDIYIHREISVQ